jgi:chromosome segregation ATPase
MTAKTTPAKTTPAKTTPAKPAPAKLTPEQEAANKAEIAKAKASQAAKDAAAKAQAKADKEAAKAKAKAEADAAKAAVRADKEAAAKAKADAAAKAKQEHEAEQAAARQEIAGLERKVQDAQDALTVAKDELKQAKARAGFSTTTGTGASTDALRAKAASYVHDKERKTAGGNTSVDNGDELAQRLRGMDLDAVYAEAASLLEEETEATLRARYSHLNLGMQRMNLGNRIRGVLNAK